ncbi:O-antigen ligase family protein [Solirubrum puertoriconensis]|uniref:O-antigen ligase-related domain-containing protein n=1 Tax=Solirubrum puertoriconensis TaxID=1751427 RepID=A0A9X0HJU8_SOLP1|nr:O-antigen ligase family protein [Solirubrum puertoriconensis]KUG07187.1 hypothetical protein ASU33_12490 [Solirubrum puertoriconensis]
MIISLRFRFLIVLLVVLLTDRAFTAFAFEDADDPVLWMCMQLLTAGMLGLSVLYLRCFSPTMRKWYFVMLACLAALALESRIGWDTWMVYPHVFNKLLVIMPLFAVYGFYRRYGMPPLSLLMGFLLVGLAASLVINFPEALSLASFVDNERGFNVESTYLLLLLALYYFNQYMAKGGLPRLLVFFVALGMIVFLQHRTVWLCTLLALTLNVFMLRRTKGVTLSFQRFMPLFVLPIVVALGGGIGVVLNNPEVLARLETSIEDIQNPDKQGTGSWRLQQFRSYEPFIQEHPVAGMRLKGFELPIQFYSTESKLKVWKDGTGHHFHSWYVDRLFYFGIIGVLLVLVVPIKLVIRRLRSPEPLDANSAAFLAFLGSSLLYSFSYDWPYYMYSVYGFALAIMDPLPVAAPAVYQPRVPRRTRRTEEAISSTAVAHADA